MRRWPPIDDPRVLEWLALDKEGWFAALRERVAALPPRAYDDQVLAHALGYPWKRPAGSYVLREGRAQPVEEVEPNERAALVARFAEDRHPLVAFGANGAPTRLRDRFAEFESEADRTALVLTGWLHDVDVAAQATPTVLGTMPGVLVASPGTAVRASILWLTSRQLTAITWAELGYRLGRLDRAHFEMDEAGVTVDDLFAFVSRIGALCVDGEPAALAAVPARGRRLRALTQEQLLEEVGRTILGRPTTAAEVVRMCTEDIGALLERALDLLWLDAPNLPDDHWTPYPTGPGP